MNESITELVLLTNFLWLIIVSFTVHKIHKITTMTYGSQRLAMPLLQLQLNKYYCHYATVFLYGGTTVGLILHCSKILGVLKLT
jgi:hypothetical protein